MFLSCFSIIIHSERNESRKESWNVPDLTDSFLLELNECVQRWQTANVVAQWTLQGNNTLTDLQVLPSFCSAYFPRCMLSVPLRIILLSFSTIHIIIVLHLHSSNVLLIFSSVTRLPSHFHNHVNLFFVTLLCRMFAKLQKKILLTLRRLMSYIYGAPILDVSRSHTTTQHSR